MDYPNPYNPEHLAALNSVIAETSNTAKLCADCAEVGFPFPDEAATNQQMQQAAMRIKQKWFPNSP